MGIATLDDRAVLRDGSTARLRTVQSGDEAALREFLDELSIQSRAFRFFTGAVDLGRAASWAADVDGVDRFGVVAVTGEPERIIGHGVYVRFAGDRAEVAFEVSEDRRDVGLATLILGELATTAKRNGITTFTASVMPSNHPMIGVFRESGFPIDVRAERDSLELELPTSLSRHAREQFAKREQIAAAAAVRAFLEPRSVALIGASRHARTIGNALARNLRAADFTGALHLVNARGGTLRGEPLLRSISAAPSPVDVAVVAVPAAAVAGVARECAAAGVRALVVISAGFAETGEDGARRQRELVEICRASGMRLVGPNCLGVLNTASSVRLDATFGPRPPAEGSLGFMSQSGGVGIAVMEHTRALGLGLSSFVSVGNKADISGNDLLQYWEDDPRTDVVLLYLESFGNARKFARIARRIGMRKPVVAVKSGRSLAGARAAGSHTGAILSASDISVDALFAQSGVIRAESLGELFDVAIVLAEQPLPEQRSVAILTNAGGPGILAADACAARELAVAPLSEETQQALRAFLPSDAAVGNPVDMVAGASAEDFARAVRLLAADEAVGGLVVIFVPTLVTSAADVAAAVQRAACDLPRPIPVVASFQTAAPPPAVLRSGTPRIPAYAYPEDAVRALARAADYARWRVVGQEEPAAVADARTDEAAALLARALGDGGGWLGPEDVATLLDCYGIVRVEGRVAHSGEEVVRIAHDLGGPVAVKAVAAGLVHKTDAGGVTLGLSSAAALRRAVRALRGAVAGAGFELDGLLVQRMAPPGVEMLAGVVQDPSFGPVIACGAGGTVVELVHDVAVRITPLTTGDAHDMVRSLRTFPLLDGYRGAERADVAALEDTLLRISALVEAHPEVAELDANPVIVTPDGATVVDARVRVEQSARSG